MKRAPLAALSLAILALPSGSAAVPDPPRTFVAIPDPAGESPAILTLDDCVAAARAKNPDLARERLRRDELRGQGFQALSSSLPSIDVSGSWSRSRDPSFLLDETFAGEGGVSDLPISPLAQEVAAELSGLFRLPDPADLPAQTFWRSSVSSDWELNPFRLSNSAAVVRLTLRQHEQDLRATDHRVAELAVRTFHEVVLQHERAEAIEAEIEARREFLDTTRRRFALGLATELDTLRAAVSLANLAPQARRARKDLRNAASRLNIVMGREAATPLAILSAPAVETDPVDGDAAAALALRRPDLRSVEIGLAALRKRRGAVRADARPYLTLGGSYGWVAREIDQLGDYDFWRADVSLVLPVFDGLLTRGRVAEVNGQIASAEETLVEARRRARLEVVTTLEELDAARENLGAAELNLQAAERALAQMRLRWELGQAQYLDVLDAQAERFAAHSNVIGARHDVLVATAELKRSLGVDPVIPLAQLRAMLAEAPE